MGILSNVLARLGYTKAAHAPLPGWASAWANGARFDVPDGTQAEQQANLYVKLTWIAAAVSHVAQTGAAAALSVKQMAGGPDGDDKDLPNHALELLWRKPNPLQSRGEFVRDALSWFKVTGNLYIHKNAPREGAPPAELWIVPSHLIRPVPDGRSFIKGYVFRPATGETIHLEPWEILHLKTWNPLNPFVGMSELESLALVAKGDEAQQRWNFNLFAKDNAKIPGAIAFKHMIDDPNWERIQAEAAEKWGGTKRAGPMMLRGVGDAVSYLPMALSQKEMEFLESRAFTKEEIWGKLAPGLSSILAVNATEANAIAGKATLIEYAVWPLLVQLAEKITTDLLPAYGDNLVAEFDDIRQTNRILDLQEQEEYSKTHTVNEIRAEYYGEDPLYLDPSLIAAEAQAEAERQEMREASLAARQGQPVKAADKKLDPRGLMFPAQIGPATPMPGGKPAAPAVPPMAQQEGGTLREPDAPSDEEKDAEMKAWEKFAVKRLGKGGREFEPRVLPLFQAARIQAALKGARTETDVRRVFEREREPDAVTAADVQRLADAIDRARERLAAA